MGAMVAYTKLSMDSHVKPGGGKEGLHKPPRGSRLGSAHGQRRAGGGGHGGSGSEDERDEEGGAVSGAVGGARAVAGRAGASIRSRAAFVI